MLSFTFTFHFPNAYSVVRGAENTLYPITLLCLAAEMVSLCSLLFLSLFFSLIYATWFSFCFAVFSKKSDLKLLLIVVQIFVQMLVAPKGSSVCPHRGISNNKPTMMGIS
jgi:hypothetical protein